MTGLARTTAAPAERSSCRSCAWRTTSWPCTTAVRRRREIRVDTERSNTKVVNSVDEPSDLAPGESLTFLIRELGPWTDSTWQITVRWEGQEEPVCVPLPAGQL